MELVNVLIMFFAVTTSMYFIGRGVLSVCGFDFQSRSELVAFSIALGYGLISYFILFLGMGKILYAPLAAIVISLSGVAGYVLTVRRRQKEKIVPDLANRNTVSVDSFTMGVIVMAFIAWFVTFLGAVSPSFSNDSMVYHLADAKAFASGNYVGEIYRNSTNSLWPYLVEMYYTLSLLFGVERASGLFHWLLGSVSAIGVYALAVRSFGRRTALLAVGIFLLTPGVFMEAKETYVDLGSVLYTLTSFMAFLKWLETKETRWAGLAGVMAGLGMSVKYFGIVLPLILAGWFIWEICVKAIKLRKGVVPGGGEAAKALFVFCVFTFIFSFVWYLRQWLILGNPFFPFFTGIFGTGGIDPETMAAISEQGIKGSMGLSSGIKDLLLMPWRITMFPGPFGGQQLGVIFLFFFPLVAAVKLLGISARRILMFFLAYSIMWFFGYQNLRFFLPAVPFLAILSAIVIFKMFGGTGVLDRIGKFFVGGALLFSMLLAVYYNLEAFALTTGIVNANDYLSGNERSYEVSRYINSSEEINLLLVVNEGNSYYFDKPNRRELYYWIYDRYDLKADSPLEILKFFKEEGFTHLLFADYAGSSWKGEGFGSPLSLTNLIEFPEFRAKYLEEIYSKTPGSKNARGLTYRLYRIL